MSEPTEQKDEYGSMPSYPMFGVTSFAELDEIQGVYDAAEAVEQLASQFCAIAYNIAIDETVTDKPAAMKALTQEFVARVRGRMNKAKEQGKFLSMIKTWLGKKAPGAKPADDTPLEVISDEAPTDTVTQAKQLRDGFTLWKTKEGSYRWMAIYSNQFRDSDYPPEILSEKAHKTFVAMVDAGLVDYPELWHWHIPGTAWGKADWVAYDNGFALASGYVLPGHEKEAELVSQMEDVRVSHGMPSRHIVRNKEDQSIIDMYVSVEISPLPGWAAANKLTDFVMLKEFNEMLSPEKRDYLSKAGLDEATISQIEASLAEKSKAAKDAGIEAKEQEPAPLPVTADVQPAVDYATRQEVADVFAGALKPLAEAIAALQSTLTTVQAEVKSLKESDEKKVAEKAAATPKASIAELIAQSFGEEARLDGRSTLAKAGPKQTQPDSAKYTGVPFLDGLINQTQQGVSQ